MAGGLEIEKGERRPPPLTFLPLLCTIRNERKPPRRRGAVSTPCSNEICACDGNGSYVRFRCCHLSERWTVVDTSIEKIGIGLQKYCSIMSCLYQTDVSKDREFQRLFNGYYRMRQRSERFYCCFYRYLEEHKFDDALTYAQVLTYLFQETGCIHASFSSKLLATVRPEMPVWDKYVLSNLGLRAPYYSCKSRFQRVLDTYQKICDWYQTSEAQAKVAVFDANFPNVDITDVKKIDFVLWQTR